MSLNQIWRAPQVPGVGGCPSCDWVPDGAVPNLLLGNMINGTTSYACAGTCVPAPGGSCGIYTACVVASCGSGVASTQTNRLALKLVGGSYDSTKKYSNGLSGCTDTLASIAWSADHAFTMDVWGDYRAGVWTGMMQVEVYAEYTNIASSPCAGNVPTCASCTGSTGFCVTCATTGSPTVSAAQFLVEGGPASLNASTAVAGSPGHCPWGGSLSYTITVYDDGTITVV